MSLIGTLAIVVYQQSALVEKDYQKCACAGIEMERTLPSGARADCVSETHAIEVESYSNWSEGIGQSLHYADETGLKPKLIMFCETNEVQCFRESLRLKSTISAYHLPITVIDVADLNCSPSAAKE